MQLQRAFFFNSGSATFYACAVIPEEQESSDLKLLSPRVHRFPFRWTRVTRTLGTRLDKHSQLMFVRDPLNIKDVASAHALSEK